MTTRYWLLSASAVVLLAAGAMALVGANAGRTAGMEVELKNVHMCCDGCAKVVAKVLRKVDGVTNVTTDRKTRTARFTAADKATAQKALDALAEAGFQGDPGEGKGYGFKDDSGAGPGKVKSVTVTGFHNSCDGCVKSFRDAIKHVPGVTGDTAREKVPSAEVSGDFDAVELVKALNKAGFHVKVKP